VVQAHDALKPTVYGQAALHVIEPVDLAILPGVRQTQVAQSLIVSMRFLDGKSKPYPACRHLKPQWSLPKEQAVFANINDATASEL
jgi:hypothetical protein